MDAALLDAARRLLPRYATAAPRYTSYPTAVDWTAAIGPERYRELLGEAAGAPEACSVYVHVPFCRERCLFCGCNVVVTRDPTRPREYAALVERELAAIADSGIGRRPVSQLHWGGGTPTHLEPESIERVHRAFLAAFSLEDDAEMAIEVDPRVTTDEQVHLLADLGFDRISIGVQDFDPAVQEAVKRIQPEALTTHLIDEARYAGFRSVNIDLIYGLPEQTLAGFTRTVEEVRRIRPERIALFQYAHVPWLKKHHRAIDLAAAPDAEEKLALFLTASAILEDAGYVAIGLDHFALPEDPLARALADGTLRRNFMGYTTQAGRDIIGLGVSSIGEVAGHFVQSARELGPWAAAVTASGLAAERGHALDADDRLRRDVISELMCFGRVGRRRIAARHGIDFDAAFATEAPDLEALAEDGIVELGTDEIRVTRLGRLFLRNVAAVFDRYLRLRRAASAPGQTYSRTH